MKHILLVFIGGGLGSVLRYVISLQLNKTKISNLPLGTLLVNVVGSLLIGIFLGLALKNKVLT
nr:CrcB family protein [Flavobacteriales bacterium]